MTAPLVSEAEFIRLFRELGASGTAQNLGCDVRNVYERRRRIEERDDILLISPNNKYEYKTFLGRYKARVPFDIRDGIVIVGSDAHYYPGVISTAHRGILHLARELKPVLFNLNGDVKDGATNGRHPKLGWEKKPTVKQELETVQERLVEIEDASKGSKFLWTVGNHDMRFDARLSHNAPEYEGVPGFALADHFPRWNMAISAWINDQVVLKHRFKGGIHATHNNTLWSGKTMVTGHLHSLKVTPLDDYNGTRYGVDTGTLADPYGDHADYTEDSPLNHRSGFVVLTFHKHRLLWPEIAAVLDEDHIQFRGKVIKV